MDRCLFKGIMGICFAKRNFRSEMNKEKTLGNEKDKSRGKRFFNKDLVLRLFVGMIALISVTLFLHFKETKVSVLELNAIAGKYVVAQVDFEFPDEEESVETNQV